MLAEQYNSNVSKCYFILLLALVPHVRPTLLDTTIRAALDNDGDFPEIGGVRDPESRVFLPTGETAAFLLAGDDLEKRFAVQRMFGPEHWFAKEGVLRLETPKEGAPILSGSDHHGAGVGGAVYRR